MRRRLLLSFSIIFVIGLIIPFGISWQTLHDSIAKDIRSASTRELKLLSELFIDKAEISEESAFKTLRESASKEIRVTFIKEDGEVLFDSRVPDSELEKLENHATRQEVLTAKEYEKGSATRSSASIGLDMIYIAEKVEATKNTPEGYVRLAVPMEGVFDRIQNLGVALFVTFSLIFIAAVVLTQIFFKRWKNSMNEIKIVVEATANGETQSSTALPMRPEFKDLSYAVSQMASRVNKQLKLINTQKIELESVLNSINAGVMVLDERGQILSINPVFKEMLPDNFSKDLELYFGKRSLEIFNSPELEQFLQVALNEEQNFHTVQMQFGGKIFQINAAKAKIEDELKPETQLVTVFHDITQLAKLVEIKRDLIANVSHELRTPLTAIQGYAETLNSVFDEKNIEKENAQRFTQIIMKNARHLDRIVNDLLALSMVESEEIQEIIHTSVEQPFNMAIEECKPMIDKKNLTLVNQLDMSIELAIDSDRLSQVFRNLIENAIRYAPENSSIIVRSTIEGEQCSIFVQDFGVGIPQDDLVRVFERFYRVEKHRTSNGTISTGLGLSLCKHIVEKFHGTIHALFHAPALVETTNLVGATIRFNLPLYK